MGVLKKWEAINLSGYNSTRRLGRNVQIRQLPQGKILNRNVVENYENHVR